MLLSGRKWDQIIDILDYTDRVDPNNRRTAPFREYVDRIKTVTAQISALQEEQIKARTENRPFPPEKNLLLARALYETGQSMLAAFNAREAVKDPAMKDFSILFGAARMLSMCGQRGDAGKTMLRAAAAIPPNIDASVTREAGAVLAEGGFTAEAAQVYAKHLREHQLDVEAWLQLAVLQHVSGQTPAAEQSILMAVRADQARAVEIINSNQQLIAIADPLFRRLRAQQQRPSNPFAPIR